MQPGIGNVVKPNPKPGLVFKFIRNTDPHVADDRGKERPPRPWIAAASPY